MPKQVSAKQLAANRRNARRSTGPTSRAGKAVSRWNALKHGLLARQVVVRGYFHEESEQEFKQLCQEHRLSLAPIGPLEEMLVGQIVMVLWRLRRVRIAESGEIATSVDKVWGNPRLPPWKMGNGYKPNALCGSLDDYHRSVEGIDFVIECLRQLREDILTAGQVTDDILKKLRPHQRDPNEIVRHLGCLLDSLQSNPKNLPPGPLLKRHLKDALACLEDHISQYEAMADRRQGQMEVEDSMRRAIAMLPAADCLEKIIRYESALQRQLNRSLNQLERLQRRRLGENVPAPAVMDVSLRG
jgi:hypothetical protein